MKKEIDNVNRRKFLEHSAKITAAGFLMNKLPARSKRLFSIEGEIKVALIGCGGRGTGAASQALEADRMSSFLVSRSFQPFCAAVISSTL